MAKPVPRSPIKRMSRTVVRFREELVKPPFGFRSAALRGLLAGAYLPGPRNG